MAKLSQAQLKALRYWADPDAAPCYQGGNRATVKSLVKRKLLTEPQGMVGHRLTDAGRAAIGSEAARQLTGAQEASLLLVAQGDVNYRPGHTEGAHSTWTRYSYDALVGGKFAKRTKSVDYLVEHGLATLAGSANSPCPVVLSETGRALVGASATPIGAGRVKMGRRVIAANGAVARVTDVGNTAEGVELRLAVGDFHFTETFDFFATVPVLS